MMKLDRNGPPHSNVAMPGAVALCVALLRHMKRVAARALVAGPH